MLVTVVIPTYNRASMVSGAIESVLRQTYPHREIIVVDDGSTDQTPFVLERFGSAIRVIRQSNAGAGVARNRALDVARGDLIAFLDSDDEWFDFKLELQVRIMGARPDLGFLFTEFAIRKQHDGQVLHGGTRGWFNNKVDWRTVYPEAQSSRALGLLVATPLPDFTIYSGRIYRQLLSHYYVLPTTAVVRRSALGGDVRFAEGTAVYEDWEFFARVARNHDAAFADVETALNLGHQTPGRLTLCSHLAKLSAHVAMIERVWELDPAFMAQHGRELYVLKADLLARVAKEALLDSRSDMARNALKRRRMLKVGLRRVDTAFYSVLSHTPGGSGALRLARKTLHLVRVKRSS